MTSAPVAVRSAARPVIGPEASSAQAPNRMAASPGPASSSGPCRNWPPMKPSAAILAASLVIRPAYRAVAPWSLLPMKAMRGLLAEVTTRARAAAAGTGLRSLISSAVSAAEPGVGGGAGQGVQQLLMGGQAVEVALRADGGLGPAAQRMTASEAGRAGCRLVGDPHHGPGTDGLALSAGLSSAAISPLAPDWEVMTSRVPSVIRRGLSSSWPVSTHHALRPSATSRRQLGRAAKWEEPIPVKMIRS